MAKKWYAGKQINPEFMDAAKAHAKDCAECGREPWSSEREHNIWRNQAEQHLDAKLPPTFLTEERRSHRVNSRAQGNIRLDIEAKKYD
jgi:hypothetical protein